MKRILCLILVLVLLTLSVSPAMATESESTIMPRYSYITQLYSGLQIGTLGLSACRANCDVRNADEVILTAKLQQYNGSSWTTLKTWTATGTDIASISKNYAVPSGYVYCLRVTCAVFNEAGTLVETATCYSNQVTY